jgi:hypothetical protein
VAYLTLAEAATYEVDDIVGGPTGRFVDQEKAVELRDHMFWDGTKGDVRVSDLGEKARGSNL